MSDDPARHNCPLCGSVRVYRVTTCRRPRGHDYEANGRGRLKAIEQSAMAYGCRTCGSRIPHVYDRRKNELATPHDL